MVRGALLTDWQRLGLRERRGEHRTGQRKKPSSVHHSIT
jgi:hypothetical protein